MGVLDTVIQMQSQGKSESEVINFLRSQGVSPREIQEALSQAQIKNAVEGEQDLQESIMNQQEYPPSSQGQGYMPSQEYVPTPPQYQPSPSPYPPQQYYPPSYSPPPQQYAEYPQEPSQESYSEYVPQEQYAEYPEESSSNFIEIAEQVVSEKMKKIEKQVESVSEFKTLSENYLKILDERLKRLEATIDQLQLSILDKIGSYGKNLSSVKKEMEMMQDSFSKVINPVLDRTSRR